MRRRHKISRRTSNHVTVGRSFNWRSFYCFNNSGIFFDYSVFKKVSKKLINSIYLNILTSSGDSYVTSLKSSIIFSPLSHSPKNFNNGMVSFSFFNKNFYSFFLNMCLSFNFKFRLFKKHTSYTNLVKRYYFKYNLILPNNFWLYNFNKKDYFVSDRIFYLNRSMRWWQILGRGANYWTYYKLYSKRDIKARMPYNTNTNFVFNVRKSFSYLV